MGGDDFLSQKRPHIVATLIFFALIFLLLILIGLVDFTQTAERAVLTLLLLYGMFLISKKVFDVLQEDVHARKLKHRLADEVAISMKDMYTELYQNSPVPYMLIDYDGQVVSSNLAAARFFGHKIKDMQGFNVFTHLRSDTFEKIDFLVEKFHGRISVSDEMVKVKKTNGEERYALLSLFYFFDSFGDHMGLLTLVDITRQKQVEDAKSEFVSLASHQLRTPIAGIKWSAELLELDAGKNLNDRQRRYIERLLHGVSRMSRLIDDFLRVSRFELGTFQPEFQAINLTSIWKDIIEEHTPEIKRKNIELNTFFDDKIDDIISDKNLLRMICENIYGNAIKYSEVGGTIHVGFARRGEEIVISIADNGMGIPLSEQEHIFTKLFRASNAVRGVPDGTGLGLYIVKQAVQVLKGKIHFTSTETIGTTFEVVLPFDSVEKL